MVGQILQVENLEGEGILHWRSHEFEEIWFEAEINISTLEVRKFTDEAIAIRLASILKEAKKLNPDFLHSDRSVTCKTKLTFSRNWGLGSSSTLISLISQWSDTDPFQLLNSTMGGSGYDIACANNNGPLVYQLVNHKPIKNPIDFKPAFANRLYFVYLGRKQDSTQEVQRFNAISSIRESDIEYVSNLTYRMIAAADQTEFNGYLLEHEKLIASIIDKKPVKNERFRDFAGEIKSLGAWGGDFVLASSMKEEKETKRYFEDKGLNSIIQFNDLVLQKSL